MTAVAFSPDGSWVASSDQDGIVIVWDVEKRRPRWTLKRPNDQAVSYCLAASPDGRWVATSHGVYDSAQGRPVIPINRSMADWDHISAIYGISFSPDGHLLAYPTTDGDIVLRDTEKWQVAERLRTNGMSLISISFSPDGKLLITGDDEGKVQLWGINPLRNIAIIGQHSARVKSAVFSPDGKQVASASDDRTIALWEVSRRRLVTRIGSHIAPVLSVAFSPDGKQLASGEHDKTVRLYTRHRSLWGHRLD